VGGGYITYGEATGILAIAEGETAFSMAIFCLPGQNQWTWQPEKDEMAVLLLLN